MTVDQLLAFARKLRITPLAQLQLGDVHDLAQNVIELLGAGAPCGMEPPPIQIFDGEACLLVDDRGDPLTVEETRGYAAMVLRTADKAQELNR